jgi:hypothetical protein
MARITNSSFPTFIASSLALLSTFILAASLPCLQSLLMPASAAPAPSIAHGPSAAAGQTTTYRSKYGFCFEYPRGWKINEFLVREKIGRGLDADECLMVQVMDYDPDKVENPGLPVSAAHIKIEARLARPDVKTLDEWIARKRRKAKVKSVTDLTGSLSPAKLVLTEEMNEEAGAREDFLAALLLTKSFMAEFNCEPVKTRKMAEFKAIVRSFK